MKGSVVIFFNAVLKITFAIVNFFFSQIFKHKIFFTQNLLKNKHKN